MSIQLGVAVSIRGEVARDVFDGLWRARDGGDDVIGSRVVGNGGLADPEQGVAPTADVSEVAPWGSRYVISKPTEASGKLD